MPANKIIIYRAIDASSIVKAKSKVTTLKKLRFPKKRSILIRLHESHAAYVKDKKVNFISIIQKILYGFPDYNILILPRYSDQIKKLHNKFGKKIIILDQSVDNNEIFSITDVFVGSGGTMTAEAALRGIPTISYNTVPNLVQDYLVRIKLVKKEQNPNKIVPLIRKLLKSNKTKLKKKAAVELKKMEDPYFKLTETIQSLTR